MKRALLVALALGVLASPALSLSDRGYRIIRNDGGGEVVDYYKRNAQARAFGWKFRFYGTCASACTVLLKNVECVAPHARFKFHLPKLGGRPSPENGFWVYDPLPTPVKRWIDRKGGLTAEWLVLEGEEMRAILPICPQGAGPWRMM